MREGVLVETLKQVVAFHDPKIMEILVVDQTAEHEKSTHKYLTESSRSGLFQWIKVPQPSLTHARNSGLAAAVGEIILYLDDDIQIPPDLFRAHLQAYRDGVDAVTGQVYNCIDPTHPPELSAPEDNTYRHVDYDEAQSAVNISGGNHSIRKKVALAIGGYDELFIGSAMAEDHDFARRLLARGFRIWYTPEAWILHLCWPGGGCAVLGEAIWPEWTHTANLFLYAFRHARQQGNFWYYMWLAVRTGPARKEIVLRPHRWAMAWFGWLKGMKYGFVHRNEWPGRRGKEEGRRMKGEG